MKVVIFERGNRNLWYSFKKKNLWYII